MPEDVKIFKQRKLYSSFFKNLMGIAITEVHVYPNELMIKTRKKTFGYPWSQITKTVIESNEVRGIPGGSSVTKILVLTTHDKEFRINVSRIRAEIENAGQLIIEIKKYLKVGNVNKTSTT